jgi:hypothetical protein
MRWIVAIAAWLLLSGGTARAEPVEACKSSPKLVGACFTVHGRLRAWNGTPTFRIHPAGTKRVIGVEAPGGDPENSLPPALEALVMPDAFQVDVDGDFLLCPFTADRPGHMRIACIADSSGLSVHRHQ